MAKDKNAFKMYADQRIFFDQLPDELAGKVIKHLFAYVNDEHPPEDDMLLKLAFSPLKRQLKFDLKKYEEIVERNKLNGQKGGRPKKPSGLSGFENKPKKADKDKDKDKEDNTISKKRESFIPPTEAEVNMYFSEKGNNFDGGSFYYFYASKNWMVGKNKMKNWKMAASGWLARKKEDVKKNNQHPMLPI